jgi:hypothetical protein
MERRFETESLAPFLLGRKLRPYLSTALSDAQSLKYQKKAAESVQNRRRFAPFSAENRHPLLGV